jgi:diacylglycerol kinase
MNTIFDFFNQRLKSFQYAFKGIAVFFQTQTNAIIHFLAAFLVIILGFLFQITWYEWALLIFAIGLVFSMEVMNTAIEFLTDLVSPNPNEKAGKVKDIAAGAVLLAVITALLIGVIVFLPKFLRIL